MTTNFPHHDGTYYGYLSPGFAPSFPPHPAPNSTIHPPSTSVGHQVYSCDISYQQQPYWPHPFTNQYAQNTAYQQQMHQSNQNWQVPTTLPHSGGKYYGHSKKSRGKEKESGSGISNDDTAFYQIIGEFSILMYEDILLIGWVSSNILDCPHLSRPFTIGRLVKVATDQDGSRFIQQRLAIADVFEIELVFNEAMPAIEGKFVKG